LTGTECDEHNITTYFATPKVTANATSITIENQFGTSVEKVEASVEGISILKVRFRESSSISSMSHLNILPIEETVAEALLSKLAIDGSAHLQLLIQLKNMQTEYQYDALKVYLFENEGYKNG